MRLKHLARIAVSNVDKKSADEERRVRLCNYTDVYYNGLITANLEFMRATASDSQIRDFCLRPGDVLITKDSETPDDIAVPALVAESADDLVCGYHLALIRPNQALVDPGFLFWTLASTSARSWFSTQATGVTRFGLRAQSIADARLSLPPIDEQREIADFLDAETARIDALIEKKRRLMELLASRFAGKAASTILHGLEPVSGDGQLPRGWSRPRLGVALQLHRGFDLPQDDRREGAVPVVSSGAVSGWHDTAACDPPGVVTGRYGTVGHVHYVDVPYWPLNTTLFVSDFRGNHPRWVYHLLRVLPLSVDEEKSAVTGINRNVVGQLFVPLPPVAVQREIAAALDAAETQQQALINRLEKQIDLLRERRRALITAAVTGELEVARAAA
jgi:type I restriction enzyme S subunit